MRILIGIGGGLAVGLLFLVQFLGWCDWFPSSAFMTIHAPALILTNLIVHGEAGWSVIPFMMVTQWMIVGALVGLVLHFRYGFLR